MLYSNTALAHQVGKTHDWVVLYFDGRYAEQRATVVTASKGVLAGRRVVRGRERDCITYYKLSRRRVRSGVRETDKASR